MKIVTLNICDSSIVTSSYTTEYGLKGWIVLRKEPEILTTTMTEINHLLF